MLFPSNPALPTQLWQRSKKKGNFSLLSRVSCRQKGSCKCNHMNESQSNIQRGVSRSQIHSSFGQRRPHFWSPNPQKERHERNKEPRAAELPKAWIAMKLKAASMASGVLSFTDFCSQSSRGEVRRGARTWCSKRWVWDGLGVQGQNKKCM